ncbi:hypothetical protein Poli38472_009994 [Pythium oligandrum]|uniref:RING-type domain-containing protein n=1 Tax=Pythium oligandrum TaxID=41045 RepID=A0A8K1C8J2_PYTOL|nr:hypothetical protein Poli38472_009994 [Pythium oligandrum]|eukprot:TMW58435.1 hypothetical protein Poli38472_009994 [Pythium oligandrum]
MDQNWADSEFEDSPRSNDDMNSVFSESPSNIPRKMSAAQQFYYQQPAYPQYQDVPVGMVPDNGSQQAKRVLVRRIQQDSLKMLTMSCQAVLVRGVSGNYFVYHLEITSDFYHQKWVVCKRYSEFYRLRKRLLTRLAAHKKHRGCQSCATVGRQLKDFGFPSRFQVFADKDALVAKRTNELEEFIVALCQYMSGGDGDYEVCTEINSTRFSVKEFLQFPLQHEIQHVRAIRQLKYVDPRDVHVDTESCPICLSEWRELDGNQLVLSPCGHFFHEHCINEWYRTRFDCPMCRTIAGEDQ